MKKRGRPPGKKNIPNVSDLSEGLLDDVEAAPAPQRQVRTDNREHAHEPRAGARGGAVARGRDGQILTRTRRSSGDKFEPGNIIPEGWDYQWNVVSVLGSAQEARQNSLNMQANGWTPVPASRHPGVWTPVGYEGEIVVEGVRLEERPLILSQEARREDIQKAKQLIQDRNEALKLAGAKDLPSGMVPTRRNNVRMSMDASLDADIPRSSYQPPEPGE